MRKSTKKLTEKESNMLKHTRKKNQIDKYLDVNNPYRSISKAEKSLPKSPRKKVEIISKLATKHKLMINLKGNRGRKPNLMDQHGDQFLIEFLERPDITYTNARRKDCV